MASAILTVLYPLSFSVYDYRSCEVLERLYSGDGFVNLQNKTNFDSLWNDYESFVRAVKKATPSEYSLRYKDRWLWGKSLQQQLKKDIAKNFLKEVDI